ncbi:hypothetical protein A2803_02965 [Candidatus Woesebacteria bacterium RIFCSPHIGHO2_01_FULL_44_21]|uniref:Uncharacterized protein n=1 Tax=Candidatus Woesebacteria bacterium RIFCSPHIGHO2_01_FULL_44_21 TaxID=1802503 RepID=A0A1F7Z0B0_9BACT|nr:MAG: hypothetical protein A2803_02965 [Candidatus Woesebacteria bacterium RIFCSPHIGHO2_01_FULL_44_21]OGM69224.1 MAG: hypothetical protein A2897_04415 [Candidatus Woesebacteria bacterium RIFCSPLOWO2_01_FULL_44_24b]
MMKVILSREAEKQFRKLPKTSQIIITRRVRQLKSGSFVQIEKLTGYKDIYRTRVGQYRIVYRRFADKLFVVLISHRREVYKLLKDLLK